MVVGGYRRGDVFCAFGRSAGDEYRIGQRMRQRLAFMPRQIYSRLYVGIVNRIQPSGRDGGCRFAGGGRCDRRVVVDQGSQRRQVVCGRRFVFHAAASRPGGDGRQVAAGFGRVGSAFRPIPAGGCQHADGGDRRVEISAAARIPNGAGTSRCARRAGEPGHAGISEPGLADRDLYVYRDLYRRLCAPYGFSGGLLGMAAMQRGMDSHAVFGHGHRFWPSGGRSAAVRFGLPAGGPGLAQLSKRAGSVQGEFADRVVPAAANRQRSLGQPNGGLRGRVRFCRAGACDHCHRPVCASVL